MPLYYCNNCKEKSMKLKMYKDKDNSLITRRVMFCLNKGCGRREDLPPLCPGTRFKV